MQQNPALQKYVEYQAKRYLDGQITAEEGFYKLIDKLRELGLIVAYKTIR